MKLRILSTIFVATLAMWTSAQEPVAVSRMPANTVIFNDGTTLLYPDGWNIDSSSAEITYVATLVYGDSLLTSDSNVIVTIQKKEDVPLEIGRDIAFGLASIYTGKEDFIPERDVLTETTDNGYTIEYLDTSEAEFIYGNTFVVDLNDETWVWLIFNNVSIPTNDGIARQAEVLEMARQITSDGLLVTEEEKTGIRYEGFVLSPIVASCMILADDNLISEAIPYALIECPANCVAAGNMSAIWGTDIYTADSGACTAAVHAGAIDDAEGGLVLATWLPGQSEYVASEQNGVVSNEWAEWDSSFSVETFDLEAYIAANPDAVVEPSSDDDALLPCDIIPQSGTWSYAPLTPEVNTCPDAMMGFFETFNAPLTSQVDFGDTFDPETLILTSSTEPFPGSVTFNTPEACTYTATYEGVEGTFIYTWEILSETEINGSFDFNFAEGLDCQLLIPYTTERTGE